MFERSSEPSDGGQSNDRHIRLDELADRALAAEASHAHGHPGRPGELVRKWIPASWVDRSPARWHWISATIAVLALLLIGGALLLGNQSAPEHPPPLPLAKEKSTSGSGATKGADTPLVVSVVGKVATPGLVTLPAGSRVADAIQAAGGAPEGVDLTGINLARRLVDGEQLAVGITPASAAGHPNPANPNAANTEGGVPGGKLNLNIATAKQLDELPGVGEVTAQRIVDWREQHGSFTSVEQLREVEGIGETRFARLREQVAVT